MGWERYLWAAAQLQVRREEQLAVTVAAIAPGAV